MKNYLFTMIGATVLTTVSAIAGGPCGPKGTVDERIKDCGFHEKEGFQLVTRTANGIEVHMDTRTKLLWSDRLEKRMDFNQAKKACQPNIKEVAGIRNVKWRLPSFDDWRNANDYSTIEPAGIRAALPRMFEPSFTENGWRRVDNAFWSSTVSTVNPAQIRTFDGQFGGDGYHTYWGDSWVRCVAQL
jgi:hypothetical protein